MTVCHLLSSLAILVSLSHSLNHSILRSSHSICSLKAKIVCFHFFFHVYIYFSVEMCIHCDILRGKAHPIAIESFWLFIFCVSTSFHPYHKRNVLKANTSKQMRWTFIVRFFSFFRYFDFISSKLEPILLTDLSLFLLCVKHKAVNNILCIEFGIFECKIDIFYPISINHFNFQSRQLFWILFQYTICQNRRKNPEKKNRIPEIEKKTESVSKKVVYLRL